MSILKIFDQTAPFISGYSVRSRYISEALHKAGVPVKILRTPRFEYANATEKINGVEYFTAEKTFFGKFPKLPFLKEYNIISSVRNTIIKKMPEGLSLIHAHSSVLNGIAGISAAKRLKLPFMYEVRALWEDAAVDQGKTGENSARYNFTRRLETDIMRKADKVSVICEGLKEDILRRGVNADKIIVAPNGVDSDVFVPLPRDNETQNLYGLRGSKVIGFIGTFFAFEGIDLLIKAAPLILRKRKDVKFLIVGHGPEALKLKETALRSEAAENIIFTGRVAHEEILKYYSVMDIVAYPRVSKRITELVTPLKPLEAMACGKTAVGSSVGGIKELIRDGYNGVLFRAGDAEDLAEKCVQAMNDPAMTGKIAEQARKYAVERRNWTDICGVYIEAYKELGAL